MVSEQVMKAFRMEPLETKVKSLASEQQMFKEMQEMLVVMLARIDQYLSNPMRLDQTISNQSCDPTKSSFYAPRDEQLLPKLGELLFINCRFSMVCGG
jgi:hypothetical protein